MSDRITASDARALLVAGKAKPVRNKYGSKRAKGAFGRTYDSKREGIRAAELALMLKAGTIQSLVLQPTFPLPGGVMYRADFGYVKDGEWIVEDVKGFDTPLSKLKRAQVEEIHGIEIRVVK